MSSPAVGAIAFERRYRHDPDPWDYETSTYERDKYARTLDALPPGPIEEALEIGSANGVFTSLLADRCDRVLAVDFSASAVRLARDRTSELGNVEVEVRDARTELPTGSFGLVVCSEVLYYWTEPEVRAFCAAIPGRLRPGGRLITVHWSGNDPEAPLNGERVGEILAAELEGALARVRQNRHDGYVLDAWDDPSG